MQESIKKQILKIYPSDELKVALNLNDYDMAITLLQEGYALIDIFYNEFELFNLLYEGISEENINGLHVALFYSVSLFMIENAIKVIEVFKAKASGETINPDELFKCLQILNSYDTKKNLDLNEFINKLLELKDTESLKKQAFMAVFETPILDEYYHAYTSLSEYLEALIHSKDLTSGEVALDVLNEDVQSLMDKVQVLVYLKEKYYELNKPYLDELRAKLDEEVSEIEQIGLKR